VPEPDHLTDHVADALTDNSLSKGEDHVPGPSPNSSTNLMIQNILLRSVGRVSRITLEKALLGKRYGTEFAKDAVENRSVVHTLAAYGVTKLATKSLPGFALVSTGLLAKTLFDRSQGKRKARKAGEKALRDQADPDGTL